VLRIGGRFVFTEDHMAKKGKKDGHMMPMPKGMPKKGHK